jgi:biopolymer transport protein ExbD
MALTAGSNAGQCYSQINMTPLIDVMLVLLIIFIITLPSQTHAIKIDNPSPHATEPAPPPEIIDLQIDFDGTLLWNARLHQCRSQEITAARSTHHGGQIRQLPNGGADPGRFAATRPAKNGLHQ